MNENKTVKFQMMLAPSEVEAIDNWMFENRLKSRAEAIRRLSSFGLIADGLLNDVQANSEKIKKSFESLQPFFQEDTPKKMIDQQMVTKSELNQAVEAHGVLTDLTRLLMNLEVALIEARNVPSEGLTAELDAISSELKELQLELPGGEGDEENQ